MLIAMLLIAGFAMAQRLDNTNSTVPQRGAIEKFTKQIILILILYYQD